MFIDDVEQNQCHNQLYRKLNCNPGTWMLIYEQISARPGVGKHFLRRATLKMLLLSRAACLYYIYYIYNRFENFKKVLYKLPQNEGNNSHFRWNKNAVSNEMCTKIT